MPGEKPKRNAAIIIICLLLLVLVSGCTSSPKGDFCDKYDGRYLVDEKFCCWVDKDIANCCSIINFGTDIDPDIYWNGECKYVQPEV